MAFWNREKTTKSWNLSVADLDKLMDIALVGDSMDAWGSSYYRGVVKKIATTTRAIPRTITTLGGADVEEDELPFKIDLNDLLYRSSVALSRFGRAYWGLDTRGNRIDRVKWFNPATITEDTWPGRGLVSFTRRHTETQLNPILYKYNKDTERVEYGDNGGLAWVWSQGMQEIGPGDTLNDDVGLPASLLQYADSMMKMLFMRGGINKWIAQAENRPNDEDEKRIRANMQRLLGGGVSNSSTFEVFSSLLSFQQLGTNPKDLEMETVNTGNKGDVSAGALTPQMLINPEMASNRATIDRVTASWLSDVVVPHGDWIVAAMNHHIFEPEGYRLALNPDAMGANQEDEVSRAQAWATYVDRQADPITVAEMLGLNIPDGRPLMVGQLAEEESDGEQSAILTQDLVLNGAQISSAVGIIDAYARGLFPRDVAVNMMATFFNIPLQVADSLVPISSQAIQNSTPQQLSLATPKTAEWRDERRQFKAWYRKRIGGDITDFTAYHITDKDKEMVIAEVLESDVWEGY